MEKFDFIEKIQYKHMIMKYTVSIALLFTLLFPPALQAAEGASVTGLWLTKKHDAAVKVETCGDEICGYIAWLREDEDTYSISGAPLCHAQVLKGFKASESEQNQWTGGQVYKADDDKTYSGTLTLVDENTVKLRAYLGFPTLGKTKTLTRASVKNYPPCAIPKKSYAQKLQNITPAAGNE